MSVVPHKKHYPFWYGGLASMVAATSTHPLDLTKVRLQTAHVPGGTMINTFFSIIRNEGVLAIYSGLSASLLRQGTYSTARFGMYEWLKESFTRANSPPPMYVLLPISMVAGCVGGVIGNPADIVNIRMQNDRSLPVEQRRNYRNAIDGIVRIVKDEGFMSLTRGIVPNMSRGVLMTSSQMVSYDKFKQLLVGTLGLPEAAHYTHFSASLLAGLVATTICSPVDVVKTRVMNAAQKGEGAFTILRNAVKTEGIGFAFRGWLPSFIRLGPQTILTFLVLEQLKHSGIGQ